MRALRCLLTAVTMALSAGVVDAASSDTDTLLLRAYVDAVIAGDWDNAERLWHPDAVARSRRLGIRLEEVPLKFDCSSPLFLHLDSIRSGAVTVSVQQHPEDSGRNVLRLIVSFAGQSMSAAYGVVDSDGPRRLAPVLFTETGDWHVRDTRYLRIRCRDTTRINGYALDRMDRFVDSVLTYFGAADARRRILEREKIEYVLTDREGMLRMTGYDISGLTDLPLDAIVTKHLCHTHELVHVLVNFVLESVPLYTLPWMQEGLAVALGGRWEKAPEVVLQVGAFLLESGLISIDEILSYDGFHEGEGTSDLSYALSGLLVRCLMDSLGPERSLDLYRDLSGPKAALRALPPFEIKRRISTHDGIDMSSASIPCTATRELVRGSGLHPCNEPIAAKIIHESRAGGMTGTVSEDDSMFVFEIRSDTGTPDGTFLVGSTAGDGYDGYRSALFERQHRDVPYGGEVLGIVFDDQEVGLYDYRTDMLLSKFAAGFSFGKRIWDPDEHTVRFGLDKTVVSINIAAEPCRMIQRPH
ncbi:MAG TPA: hypothetical protein VGB22_00935 [candidate division Zixibacteria bacterium]